MFSRQLRYSDTGGSQIQFVLTWSSSLTKERVYFFFFLEICFCITFSGDITIAISVPKPHSVRERLP